MSYSSTTTYNYLYVDVKEELYQALFAEGRSSNKPQVRIFKSDPVDPAHIPCIGINRTNLNEDGNSNGIGRVARTPTYNPTTKEYTTYSGAYMQESVEVRVFHTNPDERDKLGIFALAALYAVRSHLEQMGLANMTISGGRDEQDNNLLGDRVLYMHTLSMHYLNPLDVTVTTIVEDIASIDVTPEIMP